MTDRESPVRGTDRVARYLLDESRDGMSEAVVTEARQRLLDTLAAITAGHQFEEMATVRSLGDTMFGPGAVTVLDGSGASLNAAGGTLVNSLAANVLDVDDGHRLAQGHPAAVVAPAALAAAQEAGGTVGDVVDAFVPAYEIAVRSALAMHDWAGMHTGSGSWGAVGAAAAVARIREVSLETAVDALGIAEFNAPITPVMRSVANPASSMTKDGIGWGGFVGMAATTFAEHGVTGSGTVYDEIEYDGPDPELIESLGERYHIREGYVKPYAACRWVHSGIDALRELLVDHDVDVDAVREIRVHTHRKGARLGIRRPTTPSEAEYSYPFTIAAALRNGGRLAPADLRRTARTDEDLLALVDRVSLFEDPEAQARYPEESLSRVELVTDAGTYESDLVNPRGSRERQLSRDELVEKWTGLLDEHVGEGTTRELLSRVEDDDLPIDELLEPWTGSETAGPSGG